MGGEGTEEVEITGFDEVVGTGAVVDEVTTGVVDVSGLDEVGGVVTGVGKLLVTGLDEVYGGGGGGGGTTEELVVIGLDEVYGGGDGGTTEELVETVVMVETVVQMLVMVVPLVL